MTTHALPLTHGQKLGWHSCAPGPMFGSNQISDCKVMAAQAWCVQIQEPGFEDQVDSGWATVARHRDEQDKRRLTILPLTAPAWCSNAGGAICLDHQAALGVAKDVVAQEGKKGLNRKVRIFHTLAGIAEEVSA